MPNTYNPTPEQRQEQQIMMRVCLARSILARYPNRIARTEFLLNWESRHGSTSREELAEAVRLELLNFRGWAALMGKPASHSVFADYEKANPPRQLSTRDFCNVEKSKPAPWWSDIPHLTPSPQQSYSNHLKHWPPVLDLAPVGEGGF